MKEGVIQDYYSAIGIIKIILPFLIIIEILKYFNLIIEISIVVYPLTSLLNLPALPFCLYGIWQPQNIIEPNGSTPTTIGFFIQCCFKYLDPPNK
jgi:hypothetical protein